MGEAKRRKKLDPFYGKPKRGLVISCPVAIDGTSVRITSQLDPQELRYSLLFWDKLVWPTNSAIFIASDEDASFLESQGILSRPNFTFYGQGSEIILRSQLEAWRRLNEAEPGVWSLAQGENSLLLRNKIITEGNGISFNLTRAIPVPDKTVPLAEILDFRARRSDELISLREHLDSMLNRVVASENQETELRKQIETLDQQCADVLRVTRESRFPIRLTNMKASLDLKPTTTLATILTTAAASQLSVTSALLAGMAGIGASFKFSGDFGLANRAKRIGPYRYVYQFSKELFV